MHRALDHVRQDLTEHDTLFPHDTRIREVVEAVLADDRAEAAAAFRAPASPMHAQWLRTLDLDALFELSNEYATYARSRSACAVERLPNRQRKVVQSHYSATGRLSRALAPASVIADGRSGASERATGGRLLLAFTLSGLYRPSFGERAPWASGWSLRQASRPAPRATTRRVMSMMPSGASRAGRSEPSSPDLVKSRDVTHLQGPQPRELPARCLRRR